MGNQKPITARLQSARKRHAGNHGMLFLLSHSAVRVTQKTDDDAGTNNQAHKKARLGQSFEVREGLLELKRLA